MPPTKSEYDAGATKVCPDCCQEKPLAEFNKSRKRKLGVQVYCRECQRARDRTLYLRLERKRQVRASDRRNRQRNQQMLKRYIQGYLASHPCVDCGASDPLVLVFDHVRGKKRFNISWAPNRAYSLATLDAEIAKCDVRCANCHRRRHAAAGYGPR
jgi:hypothetical protein